MKLLIDARTLGTKPSGIGIYTYNMVLALKSVTDYEIVLVSDVCESEQMKELRDSYGCRLHIYGRSCAKSLKLIGYLRYVQRKIHEEQPDIFWEPNNLSPIPLRNPYGRMWMTVHDMFPITTPESFDRYYSLFFRYGMSVSLRCFDEIIYNSEETKRETERYFGRAKKLRSYVSYMTVPDLTQQLQSGEDAATEDNAPFLYIGNLEYRKGTDILLKAYEQYIDQGGIRQLRLAGKIREDDIRSLMEQVIQRVGADRLVYLGYIDEKTKARELRDCGVFLFPSRAEGFGAPVIEAMCYNKPIITSDLSIFAEITGGAVRTSSLERLADAMLEPPPRVDKERYAAVRERYAPDNVGKSVAREMERVAREKLTERHKS